MKINKKNLLRILSESTITTDELSARTGLSMASVKWILDGEESSIQALERIADAVGAGLKEITVSDSAGCNENCIEFLKDADRATLTLTQGRFKGKVERLAKSHPDQCEIVARNRDGSMCAHVPVDWIRIKPPRELSEKQREVLEGIRARKAENLPARRN